MSQFPPRHPCYPPPNAREHEQVELLKQILMELKALHTLVDGVTSGGNAMAVEVVTQAD